MKRILVACERSQIVTSAFRNVGCEAFSCDIVPCEGGYPQWHIQCDALKIIYDRWDLVVAHPPCTYLSRVSAPELSKNPGRVKDMEAAARFFYKFVELGESGLRVCIENPVPLKAAGLPRWSQVVNPFEFGHPYSKRTLLWLYNLPQIMPMRGYYTEYRSWHDCSSWRSGKRSIFWSGIAEAMAAQWSPLL